MNTSFDMYQSIRLRQDSKRRQETQSLSNALSQNQHSLIVMCPDEFIDFVARQKQSEGLSKEGAYQWISSVVENAKELASRSKAMWNDYSAKVKAGGSYLPVLSDTKALALLAVEMRRGGHLLSKYQVKNYGGRAYVIIKGYAGLRQQLTGTRYLANNPTVVSMAIGKLGALKAIKGGVVISIVFSVTFHALDLLINDQATWHNFVAGVAVDVASATAGAAIAWSAVSAMVGATAMAAVGPIALVVFVGAGATYLLGLLADHFELTTRLSTLLKEAEARMRKSYEQTTREIRKGLNYAEEDPVGFMHRLFGIPYLGLPK